MRFYCRVTPTGLVPLDDFSAEIKSQLPLGSDVKVIITRPRNIGFHRKFFALLRITLDNLPEDIANAVHIYNIETLLAAIKVDLGCFDSIDVNGRNVIKLHSISFSQMSADEFQSFYDRAVACILDFYLVGTKEQDLLEEVESFISQQH